MTNARRGQHLKILFLSHVQLHCCQFEQIYQVFASFGVA